MRIGSLFSGTGMLDVAAMQLFPGSSVVWHCENDPAASRVLAHHWSGVPNLGDVSAVDWRQVPQVDVITGGFPCQDVSAAGRRAGLAEGTRSGQWSHMCEAIAAIRPGWVLIENVRGLLSAPAIRHMEPESDALGDRTDRPVLRAIGAVLGDLADLGYDAAWTCVRASDVGACHRRERVLILGHPADADRARSQGRISAENGAGERAGADEIGRPVAECGVRSAAGSVDLLLPTPSVADGTGGHVSRSGDRQGEMLLGGLARAAVAGELPPTPRSSDGAKGGPGQRGSSGDLMLPSAVMGLLPTPEAKLAHSGPDYARMGRAESGGHDLTTALVLAANDSRECTAINWGQYEAAIKRQEVLSRPVPLPTEPNSKGNPRLSPRFGEWMMFWPEGWVTDPAIGLSRVDQLRIIGNGVVPPQMVAGFRHLRTVCEVAA